jgi:chromosome segregation and condensation protein ScpB
MAEAVRMAEAIVFASAEPVSLKQIGQRLPDGIDVRPSWLELAADLRAARRQSRDASTTAGRSARPATSRS